MIGQTLSHFKITAKLGEGGMGAVYLAEDTSLDREVAIKVLPEAFVADPERLARFEREAKLLAQLNHPNIAGIYEVGAAAIGGGSADEEAAVHFLAMELAPGEDLSERLSRGPVPVDDAVPIALQIAEALEAAHESGVVHRDLKPANIRVTPEGKVKVLDFGLAKAWEGTAASGPDLAESPTLTAQMTQAGVILGTAAYMSPEQAKGLEADKRSDIWSFGVVLWEMLTARRLFGGDSISDTLAGVLRDEISTDDLPNDVPGPLRRLVARCLERDPRTRLRDIGEARIQLASGMESEAANDLEPETTTARRPVALLVITALLAATTLYLGSRVLIAPAATPRTPVTFTLEPPEDAVLRSRGDKAAPVIVSPDGTMMVFGVLEASGRNRLWLRKLDEPEARSLDNTDHGSRPFWSPDSRSVGFFADRELRRVDIAGGPATTLHPAAQSRGGTWAADGTILFAPYFLGPIHAIADTGGESRPVSGPLDMEGSHRYPSMLPGGRHFVYLSLGVTGSVGIEDESQQQLVVGSLDSDESKVLLSGVFDAQWAAGHLLYLRGGDLKAHPFDPERLEFTGEARTIAQGVMYDRSFERSVFGVGGDTLVYQRSVGGGDSQLRWFGRDGSPGPVLSDAVGQGNPALSADGRYAAYYMSEGGYYVVWKHDLERDVRTRLTLSDAQELQPLFSPDGERVAFSSDELGLPKAVVVPAGGGTAEFLFGMEDEGVSLTSWSTDGRYIFYGGDRFDVFAWDLEKGESLTLLASRFHEEHPSLSPDGRWLAYSSDETGRSEVYVSPFPSMEGKQKVSRDGGAEPVWSNDGNSLYFRDLYNAFLETEIDGSGEELAIGEETLLFRAFPWVDFAGRNFAVAADGQRFLINSIDEETAKLPLVVKLGWARWD